MRIFDSVFLLNSVHLIIMNKPLRLFKTIALYFTMLCLIHTSIHARETAKTKKKTSAVSTTPEPDVTPRKPSQQKLVSNIREASVPHFLDNYSRDGIDVSHYQGNINWEVVARETKISYAYLKATEGASLVDDTYRKNILGAKKAGIKVGSYHFYRPNVSVDEQFNNMTQNVLQDEQDLLPIIDIEHAGKVSESQFIADLSLFLDKITKYYGRKPMLYTFHNFYNRYLSGRFPGYHWMIARYKEDEPTLDDGQNYIMWQYTCKGNIPGIKGNVDKSMIMGDFSLSEVFY